MHPTDGNTYAINSMMEEREDYDLKREMELEIQDLRDEVDVLIAKLAEVEAERDDLAKVVDGIENLWRFWSDKAREAVGRCGDYRRRAETAEADLTAARAALVTARNEALEASLFAAELAESIGPSDEWSEDFKAGYIFGGRDAARTIRQKCTFPDAIRRSGSTIEGDRQ